MTILSTITETYSFIKLKTRQLFHAKMKFLIFTDNRKLRVLCLYARSERDLDNEIRPSY